MNAFHFSELIFLAIVAYTHASELSMDGGNYVVKWTYMPLTQEIEFDVRAKATGWVGLGITKFNSGMKKMDIIVGGNYQGAMTYLKDLYADGIGKPTEDTVEGKLLSAKEVNGVTTIRFSRKLISTDKSKDFDIQVGEQYYLAWAYNSATDAVSTFDKHTSKGYSSNMVTLASNTSLPATTAPTIPASTQLPPTTDSSEKEVTTNSDYSLSWKHVTGSSEVTFKVTVKGTGWIGLGISDTNSGMKAMDVVIVNVSAGGLVEDYYSTATTKPIKDSQQDYTLISATQTNGKTVVVFKRKLKTGDEKDIEIVPGKSYYIAWAYQKTPGPFSYHGKQLRGYLITKVVLAGTFGPNPAGHAVAVTCSLVLHLLALVAALIVC